MYFRVRVAVAWLCTFFISNDLHQESKATSNWLTSEQEGIDQCTTTASVMPKMLLSISSKKTLTGFPPWGIEQYANVYWQILCQNKMQLYDVWLCWCNINSPYANLTLVCQIWISPCKQVTAAAVGLKSMRSWAQISLETFQTPHLIYLVL